MKVGDLIDCQIIGFQDYGIFIKYMAYEGLIHISEISDQYVHKIDDFFEIDEIILVVILEINEQDKRLKVSLKKAHPIQAKILKEVTIIKGFTSLKNKLDSWICAYKGEQ